jgi:hypothetical protein
MLDLEEIVLCEIADKTSLDIEFKIDRLTRFKVHNEIHVFLSARSFWHELELDYYE